MNELSERANELVEQAFGKSPREEFAKLIEQALLAERKSVWAEAAKIAESVAQQEWTGFTAKPQGQIGAHSLGKSDGAGGLAQILRAAAEKEVVTK